VILVSNVPSFSPEGYAERFRASHRTQSTTFFVHAEPLGHLNGATSYGTHVTAETPQRALAVAARLGYQATGQVVTCDNIFTCTHNQPTK
jgi:hypothetical protein